MEKIAQCVVDHSDDLVVNEGRKNWKEFAQGVRQLGNAIFEKGREEHFRIGHGDNDCVVLFPYQHTAWHRSLMVCSSQVEHGGRIERLTDGNFA